MDAVSRRLLKELREIDKETKAHPEIIELSPESDDDLLQWKAILAGLADTPYEGNNIKYVIRFLDAYIQKTGGQFELSIQVPSNYPIHPPSIKFVTTICHPNIHFKVMKYITFWGSLLY